MKSKLLALLMLLALPCIVVGMESGDDAVEVQDYTGDTNDFLIEGMDDEDYPAYEEYMNQPDFSMEVEGMPEEEEMPEEEGMYEPSAEMNVMEESD